MSLQKSEIVLLEFLKNAEPQVMALKWTWWSGKTYFLKEFLIKNKQNDDLAFKKYSYCSLFWINSTNDLKYSIFENSIPKNKIGEEINWTHSKIDFIKQKWSQLFRSSPLNEYSGMGLLFINTKEQSLICLDDFERMISEEDLVNWLLGLISELKENRKCKIILIFNEEELWKKEDFYAKFKEKVIDIELEFSPSPEECAEKAFPNYNDTSNFDSLLHSCAIRLKIKNIRILKKIRKMTETVKPYTDSLNPNVFQQVLSSITVLSYCIQWNPNNDWSSDIPSIDYLLSFSPFGSYFKKKSWEQLNAKEWLWEQLLSEYWWTHTDNFDIELLNTIKQGYVVEDKFSSLAKSASDSFDAWDIDKQYTDIWRNIYHWWFRNNLDEFLNKFTDLFQKNSKFLSISQLNDVVTTFRKLDENDKADILIWHFIDANKENEEKIQINGIGFHLNNPLDEKIKKELLLTYRELKRIPNLKELMDILIEKGFPSSEDESILFSATEDDIYNLFNGLEWIKFDQYRAILFKYKDISNPPKEWKELNERTIAALKRFWTNKINKERLKTYWIE